MKFITYQDKAGKWRWRLKARNGRVVADSGQGYSTKGNAKQAVSMLQRGVPAFGYASPLFIYTKDDTSGTDA